MSNKNKALKLIAASLSLSSMGACMVMPAQMPGGGVIVSQPNMPQAVVVQPAPTFVMSPVVPAMIGFTLGLWGGRHWGGGGRGWGGGHSHWRR